MEMTELVDDCLFDIYKYLEPMELANVADVCHRLRTTSQTFFAKSQFKQLKYPGSVVKNDDSNSLVALKTSRVLRNFGASITHFEEIYLPSRLIFFLEMQVVNLLMKYCGESLVELKLDSLTFTHEMPLIETALFPHVHTLQWTLETIEQKVISPLLSVWFPELRALTIISKARENPNNWPRFEKLTKLVLHGEWTNHDIEQFITQNRQLKEIEIGRNERADFRVLQPINDCAIQIETLIIHLISHSNQPDVRTSFRAHSKYFNRLTNLKKFVLWGHLGLGESILEVVWNLVLFGISLKTLIVHDPYGEQNLPKIIAKLNTLEALDIGTSPYRVKDVISICNVLPELTELRIRYDGEVNTENLLKIVQAAKKLQWLFLDGDGEIDVDIHEKLREIIKSREDNSQFTLCAFIGPWEELFQVTVCGHTNTGIEECLEQHAAQIQFPIRRNLK